MPAIAIPSDLDSVEHSLIRPTYSGDCIPSWLLKYNRGWNLLSSGGSSEISLASSIHPRDFFPEGHQPKPLPFPFSFFSESQHIHHSRNDYNWSKYVKSSTGSSSSSGGSYSYSSRNGYGYGHHDHESFSSWFPPPYRVLLLISLGLLAFAFDLDLLSRLAMNPWPNAKTDKTQSTSTPASIPNSIPTSTNSNPHLKPKPKPESSSDEIDSEDPRESASGTPYSQIYFLGFLCLIWSLAGWFTFRFYVDGPLKGDSYGRHAQTLQGISVLGAVAATVWPGDLLCRKARWAFGRALRRILSPSLSQEITFSDILLADILTSYAKVLGDVWLTLCFLLPRAEHHTWWSGKGSIAVPIITSLPYLVRLRQCLSEYNTSKPIIKIESRGLGKGKERTLRKSRRPLANALKYASAFPVIWLSAWQGVKEEKESADEALALQFWLLSVFINSLFSFWWDVTNDWGLDLLRWHTWASTPSKVAEGVKSLHKRGAISISLLRGNDHDSSKSWRQSTLSGKSLRPIETIAEEERIVEGLEPIESTSLASANLDQSQTKNIPIPSSLPSNVGGASIPSPTSNPSHSRTKSSFLLRSPASGHSLAFSPTIYQVVVVLDLLLRFAWSLKLSSHLHHIVELEVGVFFLEALEILRRSAWVFLRVEWEYVKSKRKTQTFEAKGIDGKPIEMQVIP